MKKVLLLLCTLVLVLVGCGPSADERAASTPLFQDGQYRLTAVVGTVGSTTYQYAVYGNLTNTYVWKGQGHYSETIGGTGGLSDGVDTATMDCRNPTVGEIVLSETGRVIDGIVYATGCVGDSSGGIPADASISFRAFGGGLQRIIRATVSGKPAVMTYTYRLQ